MPTFLQDTAQPQITAMELEGLMEAGSPLSWSGWRTAFLEEFWLGWGLETSSLGDPDNPDDPAFWDPSLHCQLGERVGAFCWLEFCNLGLKPIKLTWNRNPTRSSRHFCSRKNPWLFCVSWAFACCCAAARQCLKKTWGQLGLHHVGLLQEFPSSWSWMCWHDLPYSFLYYCDAFHAFLAFAGGLSWRRSGQTWNLHAERDLGRVLWPRWDNGTWCMVFPGSPHLAHLA